MKQRARAALAAGVCAPALLASLCPAARAAGAQAPQVEDVLVTARHRAERAQTVPIALTSLGSRELANRGVVRIAALQKLVPTLQITSFGPRNTSFNIRGLGTNVALANNGIESGVGLYVDGVFYPRPTSGSFALPDIDSVQVLRGPQGTLFGKNTTAGAIDVRTRKPEFTPGTDLEASLGNYGYWQLKATTTEPLTDRVSLRLSGLIDSRAGTIKDITNGDSLDATRDRAIRVQVLDHVNDALTLRLIADYGYQFGSDPIALPLETIDTIAGGQAFPGSFDSRIAYLDSHLGYDYHVPFFDPRRRVTDDNSYTEYHSESGGFSLAADDDLPYGTLSSLTAYRFLNYTPANDIDDTALDIIHNVAQADRQSQFSQEFRFTSPTGERLEYSAGAYYFYQDLAGIAQEQFGKDAYSFLLAANNALPAIARIPAFDRAAADGLDARAHSDVITNSVASFTQATFHLTPQWAITGGLRGTYEAKQGGYSQQGFGPTTAQACAGVGGLCDLVATALRDQLAPTQTFSAHTYDLLLSGTLDLAYQIAPDMLAYASASRGDKGSSINVLQLPQTPQGRLTVSPTVKPERVDAYELGLKTSLFGQRILLNGDVFLSQDSDYQGVTATPLASTLIATYATSVPKVRSRGAEVEASGHVTENLLLSFNGAYTDAIYEKYPNGPCPPEVVGPFGFFNAAGLPAGAGRIATCDLTGKRVAGIARWTASLGGEYSLPIGEYRAHGLVAYLGADLSLRSSLNDTPSDSLYGTIAGYGVLDLRGGVRTADRLYDVQFWARNALNTYYNQAVLPNSPVTGLVVAIPGEPQMYGVTVRVHF